MNESHTLRCPEEVSPSSPSSSSPFLRQERPSPGPELLRTLMGRFSELEKEIAGAQGCCVGCELSASAEYNKVLLEIEGVVPHRYKAHRRLPEAVGAMAKDVFSESERAVLAETRASEAQTRYEKQLTHSAGLADIISRRNERIAELEEGVARIEGALSADAEATLRPPPQEPFDWFFGDRKRVAEDARFYEETARMWQVRAVAAEAKVAEWERTSAANACSSRLPGAGNSGALGGVKVGGKP